MCELLNPLCHQKEVIEVSPDAKRDAGDLSARTAFQGAISELFSRSLLVLKT